MVRDPRSAIRFLDFLGPSSWYWYLMMSTTRYRTRSSR